MKRLQAAMRDRAASAARANRYYYRVGSAFKGCANCGDTEEEELPSGRIVVRYTSGFQVFRSYSPSWTKWTLWCYECGAKDLRCWAPDELGLIEAELGKPPIQGARGAIAQRKYALRKEAVKLLPRAPTKVSEIERLEKEIAELMAKIKGGK